MIFCEDLNLEPILGPFWTPKWSPSDKSEGATPPLSPPAEPSGSLRSTIWERISKIDLSGASNQPPAGLWLQQELDFDLLLGSESGGHLPSSSPLIALWLTKEQPSWKESQELSLLGLPTGFLMGCGCSDSLIFSCLSVGATCSKGRRHEAEAFEILFRMRREP